MNDPDQQNNDETEFRYPDLINRKVSNKTPEKFTPQFAPLAILEDILVEEISIDGMCGIY